MKRASIWILIMLTLLSLGMVALAQTAGDDDEEEKPVYFTVESEIGRALPRSIIYTPATERMAVIDAYNRLLLVDALDFQTVRVIYERGSYHDIAFSNDGRWMALAISDRIELYETETGERVADLVDLGQAIRIVGPIVFSRDDSLLLFRGVYPAPRSIRVRENQTIEVPWLWNLSAARNEGQSTFPGGVEAWQYFDYRNGFEIGPDNRIVAALPGRLQIIDAFTLENLFEIRTDRYETDPLTVWFSLQDRQIYVRPVTQNSFIQVDTQEGVLVEFPLDDWLTESDLELVGGVELGPQAQVIGPPNSRRENPLLEVLLGEDYTRYSIYRFRPLTVTLIDLIVPPAEIGGNIAALLFVFDESERVGRFVLSRGSSVQQMILSRDSEELLVRRNESGDERIINYDLGSGERVGSFIPSLRAIGGYNRYGKNRVLAYNSAGDEIVSDFQRYNADNYNVIIEDLRYSRRFERFFWTDDSQSMVTLSGTEWRVWSVETGDVTRREVLNLNGSIMRTSSDGHRFLVRTRDGVATVDMHTGERRSVNFHSFPGRGISQIMPDRGWNRFLVVYEPNFYGQYYPGNEIAMYEIGEGMLWFMAGDDLPPTGNRRYGWVDDDSVYVFGEGSHTDQPARIYGLDYDASGLPQCAVEAFPDAVDQWVDLWERLNYYLRPDHLAALTSLICDDLPDTAAGVQELLVPTPTPPYRTPTPIAIPGVPVCLTGRYPAQAEAYAQTWMDVTRDLNQAEKDELEALLCEGIGEYRAAEGAGGDYVQEYMIIDAQAGVRATGAVEEAERISRPIQPVLELFEESEDRALGTALLAPNEELIASSSLPGELVIYRMHFSYQSLLDDIAATAQADLEQRQLIAGLPSPTPTYNPIGTPRPTLTPTITPTPIPPPSERVDHAFAGQVEDVCPVESLFTMDSLPASYEPPGVLVGPVQGDDPWTINPRTSQRRPDDTIPNCRGMDCSWSPDRSWILARTINEIYVVRPDGSDPRVLYDLEKEVPPPSLHWSGPNTLEYEVQIQIKDENGRDRWVTAWQYDILGVFPDPDPWVPEISINQLPTQIISRQPGGPYLVAQTSFSTGVNEGYKYYLYNIETEEAQYFARLADYPSERLNVFWHPLGDRLFYHYPVRSGQRTVWYQFDMRDGTHLRLGDLYSGTWSYDGRYVAFATGRRTQPIGVWDSATGLTRTYCIPETGARFYEGRFNWSPDAEYIALQAFLPKDENTEGVGQHTLILNIETGEIVDLTTGVGELINWSRLPGEYEED